MFTVISRLNVASYDNVAGNSTAGSNELQTYLLLTVSGYPKLQRSIELISYELITDESTGSCSHTIESVTQAVLGEI